MESPYDLQDEFKEIFESSLLNTINFEDIDTISHPIDVYMDPQTAPQLQLNSSPCHSSFTVPENYNTPPSVNYMYGDSPMQYTTSESGFGDESVQSPYAHRSTPGLLSPSSDYSSSHSPKSSTSSLSSINGEFSVQQQFSPAQYPYKYPKQISISIPKGAKHKYRHAKEMKIGHGGLKGEITLPSDYKTSDYRIKLSAVPSLKCKQPIHPCMLHVTVMNRASKQKRARYRTELTSPKDWCVKLDVEKGKVFYVPNYGAQGRFEIDCLSGGRIILGGNNLQLTIISPLQGKKEAEGIKLVSVIRERINEEELRMDQTAEQIADAYTSAKQNKVDLHICRLRAQIYRRSFGQFQNMTMPHDGEFVGEDISNEIIDGRDQNVGSFDLECMSEPNHCCTEGDWKVILISKYKTATVGRDGNRDMLPPVFPVFVFVDEYGTISRPEVYWPLFKQINIQSCNLTNHSGAFIFRVPAQSYDVIREMKRNGKKLRVALYRSLDNIYSDTSFDFDYHQHYDGCPFCIIRLGNEYKARKLPNANAKKRKRNTSSETGPQQQQDCSPDNSLSNSPTGVEETPGLGTLDFDMSDCEENIQKSPDLVQDCKPGKFRLSSGKCYVAPSIYDHKKEMLCDEQRKNQIIHDICDEDNQTNLREEDEEDEYSYHETDGWSTDENSGAGNTSDEDYEEDENDEDYRSGKSDDVKSLEEDDEVLGKSLDNELFLINQSTNHTIEEDFTSAAAVSKDTIAVNEEKNGKEKFTALDQETKRKNRKERINVNLSLVYIISMLLSIMLGWVAGYFSLNHQPIMTIALLAISSGIVFGWYFDSKDEKE